MKRSGFTMLELILVLVILGMTAALIMTGVGRSTPAIERRNAIQAVHIALLQARADAMQLGERTTVSIGFPGDGVLTLTRDAGEPVRHVAPNLIRHVLQTPAGPNSMPDPYAPLRASFDSGGRTDQREWAFGLDDSADTLWTIRFDALSGAPRLIEGASRGPAAESAALITSTERRP